MQTIKRQIVNLFSMNKAYILNACSTCQRILKEVQWSGEVQNIKEQQIDKKTLASLAKQNGSYEALFSKRAMKYKSMGLKEKNLTELDFEKLILEEYTFLKRPVFIIDGKSFVGNSKKVVNAIKEELGVK